MGPSISTIKYWPKKKKGWFSTEGKLGIRNWFRLPRGHHDCPR